MTFNASSLQSSLPEVEVKLGSYWLTPFTKMCLGMKRNLVINWIRLNHNAQSLYHIVHTGQRTATSLGGSAWKSLLSGSSLQSVCRSEGFNVVNKRVAQHQVRVRIGILGDEHTTCVSADSYLGFGAASQNNCGLDKTNICGNEAGCGGDNGNVHLKAFGYILVA